MKRNKPERLAREEEPPQYLRPIKLDGGYQLRFDNALRTAREVVEDRTNSDSARLNSAA